MAVWGGLGWRFVREASEKLSAGRAGRAPGAVGWGGGANELMAERPEETGPVRDGAPGKLLS